MSSSFKEKLVIISGASQGLGRALTLGFANRGADVAVFARDVSNLELLSADLRETRANYLCYAFDIRDELAIQAFVEAVMNKFNRIDVLINNASILGPRVEISAFPSSIWREVIDVNLTGPFMLTRHILPVMKKQGHGSIINVSSSVGRTGRKLWGAYCPSKFAIEGFTQMLADELSDEGIRVNSVDPGAMATNMRRLAYPRENQSKLKKPQDMLEVFYYLASDDSASISGQSFRAQQFDLSTVAV